MYPTLFSCAFLQLQAELLYYFPKTVTFNASCSPRSRKSKKFQIPKRLVELHPKLWDKQFWGWQEILKVYFKESIFEQYRIALKPFSMVLFNKKSQLQHRGEHKHILAAAAGTENLWSAAESITKSCLQETEVATHLSVFSSENRSELALMAFANTWHA